MRAAPISPVQADVVVVGGGISGMVAAFNIQQHVPELKIFVFEAKSTTGGRIFSQPLIVGNDKVQTVDLGGHWISSGQVHITALAKHLKLTLIPQYNRGASIVDFGFVRYSYQIHPIVGNFFVQYELRNFFIKLDNLSKKFSLFSIQRKCDKIDYYDSITMDDFIRWNLFTDIARNIVRALTKTTCGLEATKISALSYVVYCNGSFGFTNQYMTFDGGAREFWIKEGAQEICKRLQSQLGCDTIITNSPVLRILHNRNYVIIHTDKNYYISRYVIIAVPPKEVLKIDFEPPLSIERYNNLKHTQGTNITTFALSYKNEFWRNKGCSGELLHCSGGPVILCRDSSIKKYPILTGYAIRRTCGPLKDIIVKQLASYWGCEALKPIDYIDKEWNYNVYTSSITSQPLIGQTRFFHKLAEPEGRLHWAGTETATCWNGYMEGAVQAAHRASVEVLYQLRPQSLTYRDMTYNYYNVKHKKRIKQKWFLLTDDPYILPLILGATVIGLIFLCKKYFY